MPDILIRDGFVGNAPGLPSGPMDVAIDGGVITLVEPGLDAAGARVVDATDAWVLPGLVDPHVHVSGSFGSRVGFKMMVRGGVTTCLDLAGDPATLASGLSEAGCGMTAGVLYPIIPGRTVSGVDPPLQELADLLDRQLESGSLGLKVLGGHYPVTPEATARAVEVCFQRNAYCAIHVGTTNTGSDVTGLEELVELVGAKRVQVAHVNSYCRGQIADPVEEAARAIAALLRMPRVTAESYLALINGADAACIDGVPVSNVVKTCLRLGGYLQTQQGLESAISGGWALIHEERDGEVSIAEPGAGLTLFRDAETSVGVSFPVNPPAAALAVALARRAGSRDFVVHAFSSDGGSLPRNTTLRQALGLVLAGAMSLQEVVLKSSATPAAMLGLAGKGRIEPGADADIVVVGKDGRTLTTIVGGTVIYQQGAFANIAGGHLLCAEEGVAAARSTAMNYTALRFANE